MPRPLLHACPCCGCQTLEGPSEGGHAICAVCGWEDDALQRQLPDYEGGANRESLNQARAAFQRWSASAPESFEALRDAWAAEAGARRRAYDFPDHMDVRGRLLAVLAGVPGWAFEAPHPQAIAEGIYVLEGRPGADRCVRWVAEVVATADDTDGPLRRYELRRRGVEWLWIARVKDATITAFHAGQDSWRPMTVATRDDALRAEPFPEVALDLRGLFDGR